MTRLLNSNSTYEPSGWKSMTEDQPRTCHGCGEKLVLAHPEPLWFDTLHRESWHHACKLVDLEKSA